MQHEQQNKPMGPLEAYELAHSLVWLFIHSYASVMYSLFRYGFGRRYFGIVECFGIFVPLVMKAFLFPELPSALLWLGHVYIVLMVVHRACAKPSSEGVHTRYNGVPRLLRYWPMDESRMKSSVEPVLAVILGLGLMILDPSLGAFVAIGGIAMRFDDSYIEEEDNRKVEAVLDAELEADYLSQRMRRK